MKKILLFAIFFSIYLFLSVSVLVVHSEAFPGENAATLWEYYSAWGKSLPSFNERAKIYECLGLGSASSYAGTAQQNTLFLNKLKENRSCPSNVEEAGCDFPGANATTLSEYYSAWGKSLPSLNERAKIYECLGLGSASSYAGTAQQNTLFLNKLKENKFCPSNVEEAGCPEEVKLTININGQGTTNPGQGTHTYDKGDQVTITASPASCWKLSSWSVDASGSSGTINVTMDRNKNVTANFVKIRYTLSTNVSPSGSGSVSPSSGTYDCESSVPLIATPHSGYEFVEWSGDASGSSKHINITMDSNKNVTALFKEIPCTVTITSGPTASPNTVDSQGSSNCSVSATDSLEHSVSYSWTAPDGSFNNPNLRTPTWRAPRNTGSSIKYYTLTVTVICTKGKTDSGDVQVGVIQENQAPYTPEKPGGPTNGDTGISYQFSAHAIDPDGDNVAYRFDWGDSNVSGWTSFVASGVQASKSHSYVQDGTYDVKTQAKDIHGNLSSWSDVHKIVIKEPISPATVKVMPQKDPIGLGESTFIDVQIEQVTNFGGIEFKLRYDASIIEITSGDVQVGDFLTGYDTMPLGPQFTDVDGLKELAYGVSLLGNAPGPSGNGSLVRITAKGKEPGTTTLDLMDDVRVIDASPEINPIPVNIVDGVSITVSKPLDTTPPTTTALLAGTQGNNGWYISDVTVTLSATDSGSGIKTTKYKIDTGNWQTYTAPFEITTEGTTTVSYYSEDNVGNQEAEESKEVKIDKTPPSVTVNTPNGGEEWKVGKHDITWTATDNISGVASISLFYSTDGGNNWKSIKENEANDGIYTWTILNSLSTTCRVKVIGFDNAGNEGFDQSDANFAIVPGQADVITLGVAEGKPTDEVRIPLYIRDVSGTLLNANADDPGDEIGGWMIRFSGDNNNYQITGVERAGITTDKPPMIELFNDAKNSWSVGYNASAGKPPPLFNLDANL